MSTPVARRSGEPFTQAQEKRAVPQKSSRISIGLRPYSLRKVRVMNWTSPSGAWTLSW
jgi:hypothetical protein